MTQQAERPTGTTTGTAAAEARKVGDTAAQSGQQVAATAAEQAGQVADEVRRQAGDLYGEVRNQAAEQAYAAQKRATDGLRALAGELQEMSGGDRSGPVSDLAAQASGKLDELAGWLDRHEPGDLVEEVRNFARRRPGVFLGGAAAAGLLMGRLTRGVVDSSRSDGAGATGAPTPQAPAAPAAAEPPTAPVVTAPPTTAPPTTAPPTTAPPGSAPPPPTPPPPGVPPPAQAPPMAPPLSGQPTPGGPAYPPAHAPEPQAGTTTVGEYVEQLERGNPGWDDQQHGGTR